MVSGVGRTSGSLSMTTLVSPRGPWAHPGVACCRPQQQQHSFKKEAMRLYRYLCYLLMIGAAALSWQISVGVRPLMDGRQKAQMRASLRRRLGFHMSTKEVVECPCSNFFFDDACTMHACSKPSRRRLLNRNLHILVFHLPEMPRSMEAW